MFHRFDRREDGSGTLVRVDERPAPLSGMDPIQEETVIVELSEDDVAQIVASVPKAPEPPKE